MFLMRFSGSPQEFVEGVADIDWAFEVGEMPAVLECNQRGVWKSLSNMLRDFDRNKVMFTCNNQSRDIQTAKAGQQIVARY